MSKTLREFKEIKTDLYFLLLDARAPESTFIDSFKEIIKDRKVIVFLTKADLVKKKELDKWITYYENDFKYVQSVSLRNTNQVRKSIILILRNQKFKSFLPKIVILGTPNVGKSSLLNIITDKKRAKAENRPGVTKKNDWFQFEKKYWVLDTPGVLQPSFIDKGQGVSLASIGSIKLDILPLEEVVIGLVEKLMNLNVLDINSPEEYAHNLVSNSLKSSDWVYRKFIKDYQDLKFGKIILDTIKC